MVDTLSVRAARRAVLPMVREAVRDWRVLDVLADQAEESGLIDAAPWRGQANLFGAVVALAYGCWRCQALRRALRGRVRTYATIAGNQRATGRAAPEFHQRPVMSWCMTEREAKGLVDPFTGREAAVMLGEHYVRAMRQCHVLNLVWWMLRGESVPADVQTGCEALTRDMVLLIEAGGF